jgi:hypothetical protein
MEAETVSSTLDINHFLMWRIFWEYFIAYSHHESFRSYVYAFSWYFLLKINLFL